MHNSFLRRIIRSRPGKGTAVVSCARRLSQPSSLFSAQMSAAANRAPRAAEYFPDDFEALKALIVVERAHTSKL